jgi:hypothetical protein
VVRMVALVGLGSILQRFVPIAWWAGLLGHPTVVPDGLPLRKTNGKPEGIAAEITRAIANACEILPWSPSCLAQAFAGQRALHRRGHAGIVVIGLRPRRNTHERNWPVHAWLIAHGHILTGAESSDTYYPASAHIFGDADVALRSSDSPA